MKILHCLSFLTLIFVFGFILVMGYWSLRPYKPLTINNEKLLTKEISRGQHLKVNVDYCKSMAIPSTMYVTFLDGVVYNTIPVSSNLPTGCHNITLQIYIPKALVLGEMKVRVLYRYQVNPIRIVDIERTSETFIIIK